MKILDVGQLNTANQISDTAQFVPKSGTLLFLQQAYQEGFAALIQSLLGDEYTSGHFYFLYGCANTGAYPTFNISAGAIFYNPYPNWSAGSYSQGDFVTYKGVIYISLINGNTDTPPSVNWQVYSSIAGEIFLVPATQFTVGTGQVPVCTIGATSYTGLTVPVTLKADPAIFTDGSTHYVHTSRIINIAAGAAGSGTFNYPYLTSSGPEYFLPIASQVAIETNRATTQENLIAANCPPVGGIIMYYNTTPNWSTTFFDTTGKGVAYYGTQSYALCNGNNGTPDLRGMFIAGFDDRTSGADPDYSTIGNPGGNKMMGLTIENIPPHRHIALFEYVDTGQSDTDAAAQLSVAQSVTSSTNAQQNSPSDTGTQVHNAGGYGFNWIDYNTGDGTTNLGGEGALQSSPDKFDNRPPFYTLAYIMRIPE